MQGALVLAEMHAWLARADALAAQDQVDLSAISRIDSAGAAFLLELARRAQARGVQLRFRAAPPNVRGLLEFLQIDQVLDLKD